MLDDLISRLKWECSTIEHVFYMTPSTDEEVAVMIKYLVHSPCKIQDVHISCVHLTDTIGIQLARLVRVSDNLTRLCISYNDFGIPTYAAIAASLRTNAHLYILSLRGHIVPKQTVDILFINSLRLNQCHPVQSTWRLYVDTNEFPRLNLIAHKSTSPSMLEFLLCVHLNTYKIH